MYGIGASPGVKACRLYESSVPIRSLSASAVSPDASSLLANIPYLPVALGEMEMSPVLRPVPIAVSSQAIVPSNCLVRCAVTSVNRNSYGPVMTGVPTAVSISASVRRSKPPNPQIVTTSSTTASATAP